MIYLIQWTILFLYYKIEHDKYYNILDYNIWYVIFLLMSYVNLYIHLGHDILWWLWCVSCSRWNSGKERTLTLTKDGQCGSFTNSIASLFKPNTWSELIDKKHYNSWWKNGYQCTSHPNLNKRSSFMNLLKYNVA